MRIPSQRIRIGEGLELGPSELSGVSLQYHVLKHPLGIHRRTDENGRPVWWDDERWSKTDPPTVDEGQRQQLLALIAGLAADSLQCAVPEVHGRKPRRRQGTDLPCRECPEPLAKRCADTVAASVVAARYVEHTNEVLACMREAASVRRVDFFQAVHAAARHGERVLGSVVVLSAGSSRDGAPKPILRLNRGDGIRVELYRRGSSASWRTTYRCALPGLNARLSHLLEFARSEPGVASEVCFVERHWWEAHGT